MSGPLSADHNLLFGILALQMDFIDRDTLIGAMSAWALDKKKSLGQIFVEHKALAPDEHAALIGVLNKHLARHGQDVEKSLAAVRVTGDVRLHLEGIADSDVQASLGHVAEIDPEATVSPSVGVATSAGTRFLILRSHAHGGLGQVSIAHDRELHREVALKEIQPRHADDPGSRTRFLLEAEITGGLEHPGVVPVYGLGCYADGRPFYAMRFIRGESLKEAIARFHQAEGPKRDPGERSLAVRELLGRFLAVCNAVAYAHSRGILHRDLKPANVMLGPYGETLVVDWGLAKALGTVQEPAGTGERPLLPSAESGSAETQAGQVVGTPQYMPPEQAAGRLDQLGPASDVYSLGATLYCLLTGKPPFADPASVGLTPLLQKVEAGDFPPPRQVARSVPPALEAVCLKAMAVRPAERYESPRALAEDVEHWLADEPVRAWPEPLRLRLGHWVRQHKGQVGAAAAAAAVLLTVTVAWGLIRSARDRREEAEQRAATEERLRGEADRQKGQAQKERGIAETQRGLARDAEARARRYLYLAHLSLAQRAWGEGNIAGMRELLERHRPAKAGAEDLRGFEWRYLQRLASLQRPRSFRGHKGAVTGVAFSDDGKRLASASADATVRVWDVATGQPTRTLTAHGDWGFGGGFSDLAFSHDSSRLAAVSSGSFGWTFKQVPGWITVWDASRGQEVLRLEARGRQPSGVAFSPDGKWLAAGNNVADFSSPTDVGEVQIWDAATGREVRTLAGHSRPVNCVAFSADGQFLASGGGVFFDFATQQQGLIPGELKVWDAASGREVWSLAGHLSSVSRVAFSPDGTMLASFSNVPASSGNVLGEVKIWSLQTGTQLRSQTVNGTGLGGVAFSPDSRYLAYGTADYNSPDNHTGAFLWDLQASQNLTLRGLTRSVTGIAFHPDGKHLAACSGDASRINHPGEVKLWVVAHGEESRILQTHPGTVLSLAFSPEGKRLAAGTAGMPDKMVPGYLAVGDVEGGRPPLLLEGHSGDVWGVAWSPDGKTLASASKRIDMVDLASPGEVKIWNAATGKEIFTITNPRGGFTSVAFGGGGRLLAAGEAQAFDAQSRPFPCNIRVCEVERQRTIATLTGHTASITSVAFSPDSSRLASCSEDDTVRLWDPRTGQQLLAIQANSAGAARGFMQTSYFGLSQVAFSPDGKRLAASSVDGTVKFWDAVTGRHLLTLSGHTQAVNGLAFSPDGTRLATASADQTVRIWDAHDGEEILTLRGHYSSSVATLAFSPDGARLASGGWDFHVKLWDATLDLKAEDADHQRLLALRKQAAAEPSNLPLQRELCASYEKLARHSLDAGNRRAAHDALRKALELRQRLAQRAPTEVAARRELAAAHEALSNLHLETGNVRAAERSLQQSIDALAALAEKPSHRLETQRRLAELYTRLGDLARLRTDADGPSAAVAAHRKALEFREALAAEQPGNGQARRELRAALEKLVVMPAADALVKPDAAELQRARKVLAIDEALAKDAPKDLQAQRDWLFSCNRVGEECQTVGELQQARASFRRSLALAAQLNRSEGGSARARRALATVHDRLGGVAVLLGDLPAAADDYRKSLALLEALAKESPDSTPARRDLAAACENLGEVSLNRGALREGRKLLERAVQLRQEVNPLLGPPGGLGQKELGTAQRLLGNVHFGLADFRSAHKAYRTSVELLERVLRRSTASGLALETTATKLVRYELAWAYDSLGHCNRKLGDGAAARKAYGNCLKQFRQLSEMKTATPDDHNGLAWYLATCPDATLRDPKQAVKSARVAVAALPRSGPNWNTLGVALYRTGAWEEAIAALEKSLTLDSTSDSSNATNRLFLAMCHWQLGHKNEARTLHTQALQGLAKLKVAPVELERFRDEAAALLGKR